MPIEVKNKLASSNIFSGLQCCEKKKKGTVVLLLIGLGASWGQRNGGGATIQRFSTDLDLHDRCDVLWGFSRIGQDQI